MNTMNGGTAGDSIGYNATASEPFAQTQVYRLKICESPSCQKTFTTLAMAPMKICPECITRERQQRAAARQPIPAVDGPGEELHKVLEARRARRLAAHALSMKVSA